MKAVCPLPVVPVRAEPGHRSEMVTQILFGESFSVTEEKGEWALVEIDADQYTGWIDRRHLFPLTEEYIERSASRTLYFLDDPAGICHRMPDKSPMLLSKGSSLSLFHDGYFHLGDRVYHTAAHCHPFPKKFHETRVSGVALSYLNAPYLWGGRSSMGVDCSGLVQVVYKMCGMNLPRDAWQQAAYGQTVDFVDEAQPGDLAFFDSPAGDIVHVGIILSPGKIIHASGRVKIDALDHNGIFSTEENGYTHSLRIIRRLSSDKS
jgi:gamma-D-glutamyl-L-lysine dipeptidyl-peptidase